MSPKRWILLLIFYISYLMCGASIYYHIQHGEEKQQRAEELKERIEINEYLVDQLAGKNETTQTQILDKITDYCGKPVTNYTTDEYEIPYTWTFYHSFFFAFTVCSTVGYGNIAPTTLLGRMIMIVYSVIGIPVNGILFAGLGEYFGKTFEAIYRRYKKYKMSHNVHYVPPQLGLVTIIVIALIPGITLFILLPSWVFTYFEGWPYSISMYYSYVTMTTIGFGDYVPTFGSHQPREFGGWFVVYQIFIIVWFIFSLGYLLMIMTFITRGLQSKKLSYLEQQLSTNIKATQNRIWNGVTKDVGYLRRILNELYILKVKPVYAEQDESFLLYRSNSCPELSMYRVDPPPEFHRKRAFSECYDVMEGRGVVTPMRASSDTELDKLDKQKSFENAEVFRQTTELLAKVVCALGTVKPLPEEDTTIGSTDMYGGYHGFSDSQILASEWSYPSVNEIPKPRGRACSDFNINPKWRGVRRPTMQPNEWTWSGDNNQIQEVINNRFHHGDAKDLYRSSFGKPPSQDYVVNMGDEELKKPRVKKFSMPDGLRRLFPFKKRSSQEFISASGGGGAGGEVGAPAGIKPDRKYSIMSVPETHQYRTPPLDYYSTVTANASPSYFQNGKPSAAALNTGASYPSDVSIASKPSVAFNGAVTAAAAGAGGRRGSNMDAFSSSYQRNAAAGAAAGSRKRRESIFAQNPALAARRASMFPSSNTAALTQRRGSLFNTSVTTNNAGGIPPRRGSLFPTAGRLPMASNERRPSLFSVTSQEDREVLENTTLADLIRALEAVHTQAVLDESTSIAPAISRTEMAGIFGTNKKRKVGNAGLAEAESEMPALLSLFAGDNTKALSAAAANRLYARRATVVGTLPSTSFGANSQQSTLASPASNVLTRRRKSSTVQIVEPPPSYSERETQSSTAASTQQVPQLSAVSVVSKFKRRFSVRPTALQIPPGKAPPPGVNINSMLQQSGGNIAPATQAASSQSVLQRRLSLRPSPLARELNISTTQPAGSSSSDASPISPTSSTSSTARLLPPPTAGAGTSAGPAPRTNASSSTHSPLSRIVQISQAQRKSSMPDGFAIDRTKKPDPK